MGDFKSQNRQCRGTHFRILERIRNVPDLPLEALFGLGLALCGQILKFQADRLDARLMIMVVIMMVVMMAVFMIVIMFVALSPGFFRGLFEFRCARTRFLLLFSHFIALASAPN